MTNTFTGVVRGFSGITSYRTDLNAEELIFNDTTIYLIVHLLKLKT